MQFDGGHPGEVPTGSPDLSVIVPTLNERENIRPLVEGVFAALEKGGIRGEMIIVDDDSPDGTAEAARSMAAGYPVRTVVRREDPGLAAAVLEGIGQAAGEVGAVRDADLSHPIEALPELYRAVSEEGAEMVVGSRYVPGGGTEGWPRTREILSRGAGLMARGLTRVKDPTSGFFAIRRNLLDGIEFDPIGYKICLEIMVKARIGSVREVPIIFHERHWGSSKASSRTAMEYLRHLLKLYIFKYVKYGVRS